MSFTAVLVVFLGGGLGSVARFGISRILANFKDATHFPLATFTANMLACLILAFLSKMLYGKQISLNQSLFWVVGFCGGFSTFSTFSLENFMLLKNGHFGWFFANIVLSVAVGVAIFYLLQRSFSEAAG